MTTKLDWQYDDHSGEYRALAGPSHRIRAVRDEDVRNPFTDGDMNWPIYVRSERTITHYDAGVVRAGLDCPFECFNEALAVHWQHRIAIDLGFKTMRALLDAYEDEFDGGEGGKLPASSTDGEMLKRVFTRAWGDCLESAQFDLAVRLFEMCGILALSTTVTGYSQGDWAEVLVVAYPTAMTRFGNITPPTTEELQGAADLYGAWAWGDAYGHVVEREVPDPNPGEDEYREREWEELPDGSCWGFYGDDFAKSGLEESALECVPEMEDA